MKTIANITVLMILAACAMAADPVSIQQFFGSAAKETAEKIADAYKTMHWIESNVNEKLIFEQLLLNLVVSDIMKV